MSVSTPTNKSVSFVDRFSHWLVALITIIALLVGWLYKSSVENRSVNINISGFNVQIPQGWVKTSPQGSEVLHIVDPFSTGFGTSYIIQNIPVDPNSTVDQAASLLILQWGQDLTAFRVLDQKLVTAYGKSADELTYVFVESNPNMTQNKLPNVVRGMDYIFMNGDHAVVVTFWAETHAFDADLGRFLLFLKTMQF